MKTNIYFILFAFVLSIFLIAPVIASSENTGEAKPPVEKKQKKVTSEREAKAFEIFDQILTLTETPDTKDVLPQIETLYLKIIKEYPDTALAQESYWRLIMLYVEKSTPPEYEKAENLYREFLKKYPDSVMDNPIENTLSKSYYKNGKWDKLLKLNLPVVNEFHKTGKLSNPNPMFMYAEAKFNLGDLTEAEKSYKTVIELFPTSSMAATSKKRIEDIKKKNPKN
jgi:TolA-binding protein